MPRVFKATEDELLKYSDYRRSLATYGLRPRSLNEWIRNYREIQGGPPKPKAPPPRPWLAEGKVKCPQCGRIQPDQGKRATCYECGLQPIPSREYPEDCCFNPF